MAKDPAERYASAGELARATALALGLESRLSTIETPGRAMDESPEPSAFTVISEDP
jgi:hypothetical protein